MHDAFERDREKRGAQWTRWRLTGNNMSEEKKREIREEWRGMRRTHKVG